MEAQRVLRRARVRNDTEVAKRRWRLAHKLVRYGTTQEQFDHLLDEQGHACGMCHDQFEDGQRICIDHDHDCCPDEKRSCGKCIRGLLCISCNTALGQIEKKYAIAQAYLRDLPASRAARPTRLPGSVTGSSPGSP